MRVEDVIKILQHGFLMPAHNRKVMTKLRPGLRLGKEPQAFGMVSLTDLSLAQSGRHIDKYGTFGLVMSPPWSSRNGARKVRYVSENDADFVELEQRAEAASTEVDSCIPYPDDAFWQLGHQNKNSAARLGAFKQVNFLSDLEFMQGAEYAWESEWRIVQSEPLSLHIEKGQRRNDVLAAFRDTWGRPGSDIRVSVDIAPEDVFQIWCPASELGRLQEALRAAGLVGLYLGHCTSYGDDLAEVE
jgi:hypothetical protein